MSFWGVQVKPGKSITHSCEKARARLRISQATLGIGDATKKTIVQCNVGNRSPVFLCALLPGVTESCVLDLEFAEADDVVFSVIGPLSVYLTGYYVAETRNSSPNSDSESYGVDIQNSHSEESNCHSDDDDEYDDSFIDDGELEVSPPSPDSSSNLVDETDPESDKPKEKKGRRRQLKKTYQVVESDSDANTPENEDKDKYLFSFLKNKKDKKKDTLKTKEVDGVNAAKAGYKAKGNGLCSSKLKEEAGAQVGNGKANREGELNQVKDNEEAVVSNDKVLTDDNVNEMNAEAKAINQNIPTSDMNVQIDVITGKQNRKRKERSKTEEKTCEVNISEDHTEVKSGQKSKKRKKGHKVEGACEEGTVNHCHTVLTDDKPVKDLIHIDSDIKDLLKANTEEQHTDKEPEKKTRKKSKKKKITQEEIKATNEMPTNKRTLSNGLSIEVLADGPPDGKVAAPGKKVKLYYTAMIKETGRIFDSNVGKDALKCRLGDKESIDGWNLGIDGMHVGEKRRLVVPPSMCFRNHEENVPPESWLVYDVELVTVRK